MGAEQRRAALRVMTPCQFSVIFVDLQERPSLGETPFRLDISGVLRWFEMEKICRNLTWCIHSNVVKIRVGGGRIRSRGQARWSGRRRRTYELRPAAVASGREARDTTRLVATRGGCEMAVHRFGVVAFFPLSSLFRDKDGTSLPSLSPLLCVGGALGLFATGSAHTLLHDAATTTAAVVVPSDCWPQGTVPSRR